MQSATSSGWTSPADVMLYELLRSVASLGLRWYYRDIEIVGLERVPAQGPVILVANHWNALVDALIIGTSVTRPVRLTAKATLLDNPATRLLLRAIGVIPLRRASDEHPRGDAPVAEGRNAQSFAALLDALDRGEVVLIFPEGRSHSEPSLAPLKTGCARIALMAQAERRIQHLPIIPIGLTFEDKGRPWSRVMMHVGRAVVPGATRHPDHPPATDPSLHHASPTLSPAAVRTLTAHVDAALREVTLNFDSLDDAARVRDVAALLTKVLDRVRPVEAPDPPLSDAMRIAQRLEAARQQLPSTTPETVDAANAFIARLDTFRVRMRAVGVPINDLWMPISLASGAWFIVRESAITAASLPMSVWGRINHWIPFTLARWVGRATARNPDEPAMHTLVSGLVFVLAFYASIALLIGRLAGPWWAVAYLVSLPPAASLDVWMTRRLRRARLRARAYLTLRHDRSLRDALLQDARALRAEARRLDAVIP